MKVLIIEDEKIFANNLEQILKNIDDSIIVQAKIGSVEETVIWLQENQTDLIFLDIHLSDGLSFEIFEQVKITTPIIFLTSYDQYAIKAFKLNSIDYLIKPINIEELVQAIEKYKSLKQSPIIDYQQIINLLGNKQPEYKKRFLAHFADKIKSIETNEIAYFYFAERDTYLCTFDGKKYSIEFSLDKLETMINPDKFFRINRRYIINIKAISNMFTLSKSKIKVELKPPADDDTVVSLSKSSGFRRWLSR